MEISFDQWLTQYIKDEGLVEYDDDEHKHLKLPTESCYECDGTGFVGKSHSQECDECYGSGKVEYSEQCYVTTESKVISLSDIWDIFQHEHRIAQMKVQDYEAYRKYLRSQLPPTGNFGLWAMEI